MITIAEVKWIKITTDVFDPDSKLFAIESLQDGYLLELVWFKLLVLTGRLNNNGYLINSAKIPYTDEMLSQAFRIELGTIKRAIEIFEKAEMIEVVDNAYMVSNWMLHQSGDRLEDIQNNNKERQQRYRDRQKQAKIEEKEKRNVTRNVTNNVTDSYSYSISNSLTNISKEVIDYLNNILNSNYRYNSTKTQGLIKARVNEGFTIDDFKKVIDIKVAEWKGTDMEKYLRPETLFGTKFESYLNQKGGNNDRGMGRTAQADAERDRELEEYIASGAADDDEPLW